MKSHQYASYDFHAIATKLLTSLCLVSRQDPYGCKHTRLCFHIILSFVFIGPLASGFADRFSCRAALVLGALMSCAAFVLSAYATNLLHINLAYGVLGGKTFM